MERVEGVIWMGSPIEPKDMHEYLVYVLMDDRPRYAVGRWVKDQGFYDSVFARCSPYSDREKWAETERLLCSAEDFRRGYAYYAALPFCPVYLLPDTQLDEALESLKERAGLYIARQAAQMREFFPELDNSIEQMLCRYEAEYAEESDDEDEEDDALYVSLDEEDRAAELEQAYNDITEMMEEVEEEAEERGIDLELDPLRDGLGVEYLRFRKSSREIAEFAEASFGRFMQKLGKALKLLFTADSENKTLADYADCEESVMPPDLRWFIRKWYRPDTYWLTRAEDDLCALVPDEAKSMTPIPKEICDSMDKERLGDANADSVLLNRLNRFTRLLLLRPPATILKGELQMLAEAYTWWAVDTRSKPE